MNTTHSTTPGSGAIDAACAYMARLSPAFAERFEAARRLLARGGWSQNTERVRFADGAIVSRGELHNAWDECSCQEGRGPVVCLHQIAARMLLIAARQGERAPVPAETTADAPHCKDCGAVLSAENTARCGRQTLTICRPCLRGRIAFGRRRQLAADAQLVARALGA